MWYMEEQVQSGHSASMRFPSGQEEERQRIIHELHVGVVRALSTFVSELERFRMRYPALHGEASLAMSANLETWQELIRVYLLAIACMLGNGTWLDRGMPLPHIAGDATPVGQRQMAVREANYGYAKLTTREREMLLLVARGLVAKEIARMLAVSEKTVRNHLRSIYRKLALYDRVQIAVYALKNGLVDINSV